MIIVNIQWLQEIRSNFEKAVTLDPQSVDAMSQYAHFKLFMSDFTGNLFECTYINACICVFIYIMYVHVFLSICLCVYIGMADLLSSSELFKKALKIARTKEDITDLCQNIAMTSAKLEAIEVFGAQRP